MTKTKKQLTLARLAGFCYGVKRAVDLSLKIKKENPNTPVYVFGELIHNNQVIEKLEKTGIKTLREIPQEKTNGICIIRTHGTAPSNIEALEQKGLQIIDATCPDVKRVQNKAKSLVKEGYRVVIIGKSDHPEVVAIKANADEDAENPAIVASNREEIEQVVSELKKSKKIGVVVQTTQKIDNFKKTLPLIAENAKELKVYNTICSATNNRQNEAKKLAQNVDLMVVVGSKSSANTTHLAELLNQITKTIHIETSKDLSDYQDVIETSNTIGITAGASTPDFIIEEVTKNIGEHE